MSKREVNQFLYFGREEAMHLLLTCNKVHGEVEFDIVGLSLFHELVDDLGALLVVQGGPDLNIMGIQDPGSKGCLHAALSKATSLMLLPY